MASKVLLVEDSRAVRDYVSSILESEGGFEVVEVDNGFEALRALPRAEYALIVTDVNMPDVNGVELIRFVRQNPKLASTPVLVISTDSTHVDVQRAMRAGADAFVAKPFTSGEFIAGVDEARRRRGGAEDRS
jgi:two-component system, chemotaxis family, chemotaxis protein CheY